ncbi:MAG TPA: glycosyltransferase family 2 protein [Cyanobacteria bacterium UBA11162]|nr:glycosyltransferase family 2 protein [Cyanobacteria bacterium UBA11162]
MNRERIAVLITCHNRKPKTLACLAALFNQVLPSEVMIDVYLVDDGSTDGTAEAVQEAYPQVKILQGNGSLFWNGGMRRAFSEALKHDYDYYLWLNDDTILYPTALSTLLTTDHHLVEQNDNHAIVVGSTQDPETSALTYGGVVQEYWWHPLRFCLVKPTETVQRCDTINGNCVLIPRLVAQVVGNLDPALIHYLADYDYGLRAKRQGCSIWVAPGYIGTCSLNPPQERNLNSEEPLHQQLKKMSQPKGLSLNDVTLYSFEEWKLFSQRYGGIFWVIYWLLPYRRLMVSLLFGKQKSKTV